MSSTDIQLDMSGVSLQDSENKENSMVFDGSDPSLKYSDILFTTEEGLGLSFAMKPCPERKAIRQMVERGGARMVSRNFRPDCINLTTNGQTMNQTQASDYPCHFIAYVLDSCRENELKDLEEYKVCLNQNPPDKETEEIIQEPEPEEPMNDELDPNVQIDPIDPIQYVDQPANNVDADDDETEIEDNSDSETNSTRNGSVSRYFMKKTPHRMTQFSDYFKFLKDREQTDTPENLRRIKEAFKGLKKASEENQEKESGYPLRNKKKAKTFGKKVAEKIVDDNDDASETGYKVSDISSDESLKQTTPKKNKFVNKRKLTPTKMIPKQSNLYSLDEDVAILDFIIKNSRFEEIKGNAMWEKAERKKILVGRSWQSMKERFRKSIIVNIDSFDIELKHKKLLKKYFYCEKDVSKRQIPNTQTGFYTFDEDMAIVDYIINSNRFEQINGKKFWTDMEIKLREQGVCHRSWQSLKERFIKRIIVNLYNYDIRLDKADKILSSASGLTDDQKKKIITKIKNKNTNQSLISAKTSSIV